MKVEFSLEKKYVPQWNGNKDQTKKQQCFAMVKSVDNRDLMELADMLEKAGIVGEVDTSSIEVNQGSTMLDALERLLPKYLVLHNLEDSDGEVDVNRICTQPFYQDLAVELLFELSGASNPTEDDVKN